MRQLYIGLLSGTSMDAVDAALVEFGGEHPSILGTHSQPYPGELRHALLELCRAGDNEIVRAGELDVRLGRIFARAALDLLQKTATDRRAVTAIGSHGQTIRHHPRAPVPFTLQIGDPNTIAELTGVTTVADFRRRDMAAGGEGAPLAPALHAALFRSAKTETAVLNIGGIANVTLLPADPSLPATGFDTGPGNALLDHWVAQHLDQPIDTGGAWAESGNVDEALLEVMLADPYFSLSPPKSTGREYFNPEWLGAKLDEHGEAIDPQDVQATLCKLTAAAVAHAVQTHAPETRRLLVCGGGVHNLTLMIRLRTLLAPCEIVSTEAFGVHPDWVEAMAFAWLASRTLAGQGGNLPEVTGADHEVILGGIYPGKHIPPAG